MQLNYTKAASQGIVIETINNNNIILFEAEYNKAKNIIKDIISQQKKEECSNKGNEAIHVNNRIIFTGQRGSGKTSALLSLKQDLWLNGIVGEHDKTGFYCLPTVDPSYFDGKHNILTTVLSSMFSNAKHTMEEYEKHGEQKRNEYEALLKDFSKVYKALGQIESSENNQSYTIEKLNDISNASDVHSLMDKLLKDFKKFLGDGETKFLLVIDDLDMNVACAADMLEQLRKFLSLNDIIILMSANIDQLHYEMCEHYSKAFVNTMNDKEQSRFIEIEDMASRYLLKLFPTSRRINVEHPISQLLNADLAFPELDENGEVVRIDENGNVVKDGKGIVKYKKKGNLQSTILSLIWEKTRLLFIPEKNELHPIIPKNLRELVQFIDVLESMDDVKYDEKESKLFSESEDHKNCEKNISKFKEYFLKTWVPTNLSIEEESVFYSIPEKVDEVNKYLINAINVIGSNNKKRLMSREVDLDIIEKNAEGVRIDRDIYTMVSPNDPRFVKANKISDIFNQPSNYSYGDLLLMLDKYETYFESERDRKFSNAIKIYYSILLFETMFYRSNNINYNVIKNNEKINEIELKKRVKECVNDIIPIQRLIGGTIYYPNYFEIITSKYFKQKGPSYDAKRAFYHKVKEDETDDMPLFSVLYYGDIRPDRYDTKHVYDTTFEHDSEVDSERYKTFDILSIINNILNPWQTIARADESEKKINEWANTINKWNEDNCQLVKDDTNGKKIIQFPNSILPFYSVDMMLKYIRGTYDVQEIDSSILNKKDEYEEEEMVSNWLGLMGYSDGRITTEQIIQHMWEKHRISIEYNDDNQKYSAEYKNLTFTDLLRKTGLLKKEDASIDIDKLNEINPELTKKLIEINGVVRSRQNKYTVDDSKTDITEIIEILNDINLIEEQKWEYIINLESIDTTNRYVKEFLENLISMRVVKTGNKIVVYNHSDKKLADGIQILIETRKYFDELTKTTNKKVLTREVGLNCFRDYAIAKIMNLYSGGQREQDMLIKNLYRYNSITEMYRYLVDVLWKDAIIEYGIRQEIQQTVHSRKFIIEYYNKLFRTTEMCFKEAFGEEKMYIDIYKEIFEQAVNIFIQDETAQKS